MTRAPRAPRVFFYVQHLLGIGHLARASRIAYALAGSGADVVMVTGGMPLPGFPGPRVRHIALPPVRSADAGFSGLADADGRPIDEAFKARRRDLLLAAYREEAPDIVLIEAFPFGRRQVRFELLPLLDAITSSRPKPVLATSIRDILQARAKPERDAESLALIRQAFDWILVHGDPNFVRLEDTFPRASEVAERIVYTGLVAPEPPGPPQERYDVVVSAGGGAVGRGLVMAAAEAARLLPETLRWCLIAGPNLPPADFAAIAGRAPANAELVRFREDFVRLLAGARLSVSQAGYNTVCDLLVAGCRALLLPFAAGGETEQPLRARRLEELGLARVLAEAELTGEAMARAVAESLAASAPEPSGLDLDGAFGAARFLQGLV